jgi:hypothetical protein
MDTATMYQMMVEKAVGEVTNQIGNSLDDEVVEPLSVDKRAVVKRQG